MRADAPDQQLDVRAQLRVRHTDDNAATHCSSYSCLVCSSFDEKYDMLRFIGACAHLSPPEKSSPACATRARVAARAHTGRCVACVRASAPAGDDIADWCTCRCPARPDSRQRQLCSVGSAAVERTESRGQSQSRVCPCGAFSAEASHVEQHRRDVVSRALLHRGLHQPLRDLRKRLRLVLQHQRVRVFERESVPHAV